MAENLPPSLWDRLARQQLAWFRIGFGVYFVVLFARLLPWAGKMYSDQGMLADAALSPSFGKLPNLLFVWDSPAAVRVFLLVMLLLALLYTVGLRYRLCAVLLWAGWVMLWHRNPFTLNPSMPFNGWLMLASLFFPARPPWSVDRWLARHRPESVGLPAQQAIPVDVLRAAWIVMAVAYSYSGWTKLLSTGWRSGEAVGLILSGPLARPGVWVAWLRASPGWLLAALTWGTLAGELLFAPLCLHRSTRPLAWCAMLAMLSCPTLPDRPIPR